MGRWSLALCILCTTAGLALADTPASEGLPLIAEEFDLLTQGKTMDTYGPSGLYGVEQFLPGHRSIWRDADGCKTGRWEQQGPEICFYYDDQPERAVCWVYKSRGAEVHGWYMGFLELPPVRLVVGESPMICDFPGV